jgi:hypothetical protein
MKRVGRDYQGRGANTPTRPHADTSFHFNAQPLQASSLQDIVRA